MATLLGGRRTHWLAPLAVPGGCTHATHADVDRAGTFQLGNGYPVRTHVPRKPHLPRMIFYGHEHV